MMIKLCKYSYTEFGNTINKKRCVTHSWFVLTVFVLTVSSRRPPEAQPVIENFVLQQQQTGTNHTPPSRSITSPLVLSVQQYTRQDPSSSSLL
ncbi:MAG: hypothetical protein ACKPKO_48135, partial [Candidatus Fonsibacter sp.]